MPKFDVIRVMATIRRSSLVGEKNVLGLSFSFDLIVNAEDTAWT